MQEIILTYQGEMVLKGLNRKTFEAALLKTMKKRAEGMGSWRIHPSQSTIYLEPEDQQASENVDKMLDLCKKTFGLSSVSKAACCEKDFSAICHTAEQYLGASLEKAKTFKVLAKRADKKFPMNSMEIARQLGGYLLSKYPHLSVDVYHPELLVTVEVRETMAYVHGGKQKAVGGLPVPTSGRAALMLSGGIDSPVAAYMMAKRGLGLVAVHFASPPYTSPRASAKVQDLGRLVSAYTGPLPYFEVPYTETQEYLRDTLTRQDYFTVLMRRSMMRITRMICETQGCEAIVTGESLAQVASQTLQALQCTDQVQELPVLRPCIGMDKVEITALAREIGTYETSIQPFEDCCTIFTPPHPKTKPRLVDVLAFENAMPLLQELEQQAAAQAKFSLLR